MGWYYTIGATRKDIIRELTAPWDNEQARKECVRHATVGNVLWTVETVRVKESGEVQTFIGCYLLHRHRDGWGYKPMDESMHPYYYTCPLAYLKAAPVASEDWREGVREYWRDRRERMRIRRQWKKRSAITSM